MASGKVAVRDRWLQSILMVYLLHSLGKPVYYLQGTNLQNVTFFKKSLFKEKHCVTKSILGNPSPKQ